MFILPIKFHPDFSTLSGFPRFLFPPHRPLCPRIRFELKIDYLRHKILLYISSFIKIRSPIRKIKIPQFPHLPRISVSPSNSPQCYRIWSGFKIRALKHKIFIYEISLRSDDLFISYKYVIFSSFSELSPPSNSNKESGPGPVMSVIYLGHVLIVPTKFHPDLSALNVFQDFRSLPLLPQMTLNPVGN